MLKIALGQLNATVGDLAGNVERIASMAARATDLGADLAVFPELCVTGYPPEDLVLRPAFVADATAAVADLAGRVAGGCAVVVGAPDPDPDGAGVQNAALVLDGGRVAKRYAKANLPNYGVFDERRTFVPGGRGARAEVAGIRVGLSVCEDAWQAGAPFDAYARERPPVIVNINASPFHRGKSGERIRVCAERARQTGAWIVYVNAVGGQDELVFDGGSLVVDPAGEVRHRAAVFEEDLLVVDLRDDGTSAADPRPPWPDDVAAVYRALVLGLGDYVRKNGFRGVVLGLSGGIDSALVATLAVDALGPDAVRALAMPSPYSSPESVEDATEVARRLGVRLDVLPITPALEAYRATLGDLLGTAFAGVAEENVQARIRGNLLMAVSNAEGPLVLATGNKSEMAVGYSTLYGDLAGGFAPIKDVPKTLVYALARLRNAVGDPPIPERVLAKPPSAELRPDQRDTDSLPPYEELDPVVEAYVEEDRSPEEIAASGVDRALVDRVVALVDGAEYKRRQAPPGVKITPKAFGRDRRLPITNRYRSR